MKVESGKASFELNGGMGCVPVTVTGLTSSRDFTLTLNGAPLDQSIHGNDYWQADYDPVDRTWSWTYNLPASEKNSQVVSLAPKP